MSDKCRGCGEGGAAFSGGPGMMHERCEIERLEGLLEEAEPCGACCDKVKALEARCAEYLNLLFSVYGNECISEPDYEAIGKIIARAEGEASDDS